jgi:tetratricopeptide (TPR) repeat protein
MSFWVSRSCGLALLLAAFALGGCLPSPQSQSDEEKEPHFLEGRSRVNTMDYPGAIESFEKALEANPQSGAAHFELGWLFDRKEPDAAAAIYHYAKYLTLRPRADNAETVKDRILACKQELARAVSLGPITERQQHDLEKLAEENTRLLAQNKELAEELAKWRAYYTGRPLAQTNPPPQNSRTPASVQSLSPPVSADGGASKLTSAGRTNPPPATAHTHLVRPGETPSVIARQYGVKLDALMAANPRLDPRRLRPGQTLNIP